ncbi:pentatricopeptide repeat-containing protein [Salix suchowensis]|nr:pentatricopeptide repeat-containing protein [Salix suchowensis]
MAINPQSFLGFLSLTSKITRYSLPHLLRSSIPFSTLDPPQFTTSHDDTKLLSNLDEDHILNELCNLLPISPNPPIPHPYNHDRSISNKQVEIRPVFDRFLSPEEKLRGVFVQKIKGKSGIERALSECSVDLSLDVVAKVLNRGNLGGEAMIMFFNWAIKQPMISKDVDSYNVVIRALGRRKYIDFMVNVLHELRVDGVSMNLETLSIVMDSLVRAQEEFGLERDAESLNVLLQCLCRRSHVGAANSYFNSVKRKIPFNCMTYNVIIGGWSKFGRVSEMQRVFEEMEEDGLSPDCLSFSYLLEGLGRAGRIEDAVKIFGSMEEKGCVPDTNVCNAMISNFISVGDLDECMKYYRCLLSKNCDPNIDTYTRMISGLIKASKVADALEMFNDMLSRGMVTETGTVTSFIEPLCSFGPPHAAMVIYTKARKVGCKISLSAYKLLLMRLSRFGKCGMMLKIWDEMKESGYSSDMEVYEYLISGLCNIGQFENAVLVMEESLRKGFCPSRFICSKLNTRLLASNKVERAYRLFLKIKRARCSENARRCMRANGWHF